MIGPEDFPSEKPAPEIGSFYLLWSPDWSESGYTVARYEGNEQGTHRFVCEGTEQPIREEDIYGWIKLEA